MNYTPTINEVVLDMTTKEYVCITNGIPVKDEQGKETRKLRPTEGIVFRHIPGDGLYWSYVTVEGHKLSVCRVTPEEWKADMEKTKGRI